MQNMNGQVERVLRDAAIADMGATAYLSHEVACAVERIDDCVDMLCGIGSMCHHQFGHNQIKEFALLLADRLGEISLKLSGDAEACKPSVDGYGRDQSVYDAFIADHPEFADMGGRQCQYGDFLYARKYDSLVCRGEISYREALERIAVEVNDLFNMPAV